MIVRLLSVSFVVAVFLFAGPAWTAVADLPPLESGLVPVAQLAHGRGAGFWMEGDYAYVTGWNTHVAVVDVSDPEQPVETGRVSVRARDADFFENQHGKFVVVADGGPRMHFVNVSDPANPSVAASLPIASYVHNVAALRGYDLVYNARSTGRGIDIVDVSDPNSPFVVKVWDGGAWSCHDIAVFPDAGRAYCAGLSATFVLDIADPLDPVVLFEVDHPSISLHHWATATPDHRTLIIGDEAFGGADGCENSVTTLLGTESDEPGAVWFYDIGPATILDGPQVKGHISMPQPDVDGFWCTAHFGQLVAPNVLAVAWYIQGVILIEFESPLGPRILDQFVAPDSFTWDVRYQNGYLFTGDLNRGMDVLKIDLTALLPV